MNEELRKEIARQQVEQKRKEKYKLYLERNLSKEDIMNEIVFDLKKSRDDDEEILKQEAVKILPEILERGWSNKLGVRYENLRCYGKEPYQLWYESKRELNCCDWRKKHIYGWNDWDFKKYYDQTNWTIKNKGEKMLKGDYQTWSVLCSEKKCSDCNYFSEKINQIKEKSLEEVQQTVFEESKDTTREVKLSPERLWVFKCKEECSICPV